MSDIPPDLLAEVLREVEEEQGHPDKYTVPIDELLERLVAKGWRPDAPTLHWCVPRVRGDEPDILAANLRRKTCSPRARG